MSRNKIIFTIAAAILCLIMVSYFLYSVFSDGKMSKNVPGTTDKIAAATVVKPLSAADQLLHNGFGRLQAMDQAYAVILLDSNTSEHTLDSLSMNIAAMEKALKESIDSIEKLKADGKEKCESAGFYKKVLKERGIIQGTAKKEQEMKLETPSAFTPGEMQALQLQMLKKDERIGMLENQLKLVAANLQRQPVANTTPETEAASTAVYRQESVSLAEKLSKKEAAYNNLQERYFTLEQERNSLRKAGDLKNPSSVISAEQRVSELEAALKLSEVECNLTRADGGQIISNSKQRKSLLEQSLKILNSLASSNSPEVQKQAREKLTELKAIASMIRD